MISNVILLVMLSGSVYCLYHESHSCQGCVHTVDPVWLIADVDEYNTVDQVRVEMWVLAAGQSCADATGVHNTISIGSDNSVTAQDNADGQGVDVFNAGTNNKLQGLAFTIYHGTGCFAVSPHVYHVLVQVRRQWLRIAFEYFADDQHSSLMLYRTMQPEHKSAPHYRQPARAFALLRYAES